LLAAGGERGVIRILDVNQKSQHTAVSSSIEMIRIDFYTTRIASTNWCY